MIIVLNIAILDKLGGCLESDPLHCVLHIGYSNEPMPTSNTSLAEEGEKKEFYKLWPANKTDCLCQLWQ